MNKILSLLTLFCLISFSCKKQSSKLDQTNNTTCYIGGWAEGNMSIKYEYDANNRILTEDIVKGYVTYDLPAKRTFNYKSDRITVNELPSNATYDLLLSSNRVIKFSFKSDRYSEISYNGEGYLSKISDYSNINNSLLHTKEFNYQNGNLISIVATGGIGTANQSAETYTLEYFTNKKNIEGVDLSLNKFILPDWDLADYFAPFQLPVSFFGKGSSNLLKAIRFPRGGDYFSFTYDFDITGKVNKITYQNKNNETRIVNLSFNCK